MLIALLTVLKFAGVTISGVAAFIGTLPANHPERPENRKGAWRLFGKHTAVRWVIVGAVVALLSQFAETLKTNGDRQAAERLKAANIEAQTQILTNLTLQASRQQQTLSYIERLVAPLEPPRVNVRMQIEIDNPK